MNTAKKSYKIISGKHRKISKRLPDFYDALINVKSWGRQSKDYRFLLLQIKQGNILANSDGIRRLCAKCVIHCILTPMDCRFQNGHKTIFENGRWISDEDSAALPF